MAWNKKSDIFALMTGHGRSLDGSWDCGCTYGKYTEAGLCQNITKYAVKYLRQSGVRVISDSDNNNNKNMTACVGWANRENAKYYMSCHVDFAGASKGIYPLYTSSAGKKLGKAVGKSTAELMDMRYKGVCKRTDLYELNGTTMPAVIFECGAIKADLDKLKQSKKYGKALAKSICKYIGVKFVENSGITLPPRGYFQLGDIGENVRVLQKFLNKHDFDCGDADGIYGKQTVSAVKKFQKRYGLEADGMFGKESLKVADTMFS